LKHDLFRKTGFHFSGHGLMRQERAPLRWTIRGKKHPDKDQNGLRREPPHSRRFSLPAR
jgi:hypothetical protein